MWTSVIDVTLDENPSLLYINRSRFVRVPAHSKTILLQTVSMFVLITIIHFFSLKNIFFAQGNPLANLGIAINWDNCWFFT